MRKSPQKIENPNNKKSLKAEIKDLLSLFQSSPNAEHEKDKKRKSIFNLLSAMDQNERKDVQVILDTIEKTIEELLGSRKYTDLFVKELNAQLQDDDANANLDNLKKSLGIQKINIHQDNYREVVEGIDMANLEKKEKSLIHNIFSQITIIFAKERMKNRPDRYCLFLKGVELKLLPLRPSDEELQAKKANFKLKDLKQRLRIADTEMNSENFSG